MNRRKTWWIFLSIVVVGAGCTLPAPAQEAVEMPVESVGGEGLQWETDLSAHPPSPPNVKAIVLGTTIQVTWEQPPAVQVPHSYSDTIVHYRVFRRLASTPDSIEIGTTDELSFVDSDPPIGLVFYHVTAIHEGDAESGRSDEAETVFGSD